MTVAPINTRVAPRSEGTSVIMGVELGGTFTDVVSFAPGRIEVAKVPTNLGRTEESVLAGADLLDLPRAAMFNHASTRGLNAIITRALPKVAFITTAGHSDMLDMGRTVRPVSAITDPSWRRGFSDVTAPLVPRYLRRGVTERMRADGEVFTAVDQAQLCELVELLRRCNVEGVAICLLNAYVNPAHEHVVRQVVLERLGEVPCSISSEVGPVMREYQRATTTVIDVFMKIIYGDYTCRLTTGLRDRSFAGALNFADSAATLVAAGHAMQQPHRLVVAGPAAGTAASAHFGAQIGRSNLICCDVGGTSCDLSIVTDSRASSSATYDIEWDMTINAPSIDITTLGAGGGSIVAINRFGELTVGPHSAGSNPGPACYGAGGEQPTITDAALVMGLLDPGTPLPGGMKLHLEKAIAAFEALDTDLSLDQRVNGAWNVALHNIGEGIFNAALQQGVDPRDYSLVAYGAAGPMLLPLLLDIVRVREVIVPPFPGCFSALGLLAIDQVYTQSRGLTVLLNDSGAAPIDSGYARLEAKLQEQLGTVPQFSRSFDARLLGQSWDTPLIPARDGTVDHDAIEEMISEFHDEYERRNGNRFESVPVQCVTLRSSARVQSEKLEFSRASPRRENTQIEFRLPDAQGALRSFPECQRSDLYAGDRAVGPFVIREPTSTTFVPPDRNMLVGEFGEIIIS